MDFVTTSILQKPTDAIVMMPRTGKLTPTARKVYNVLLHRTQMEVLKFREQGRVVDAEHLFAAPLHEVLKQTLAVDSKSDNSKAAKGYFKEMRRTEVDWEAPDATSGVVWRSMGLLSEAQLELREGVIWALWALPPTLMAAVADPKRFTPLDLDEIGKLDRYAAIALYEICARYRNNPTGVTSRNSVEWWTDALSNVQAPLDPTTGLRNRREWRKYKREFVIPAIEEINDKTDLTIELLEFKVVRTIKEVQFRVLKKMGAEATVTKVAMELAELAAQCELSLSVISTLMNQGANEGALKVSLLRLLGRLRAPEGEPILNKAAYLRSLLSETTYQTKPNMGVNYRSPPPPLSAVLPLALSPQDARRKDVNSEFLALTSVEQKLYAEQAYAALKDKGLATPMVGRKMQAGEWTSGVLLVASVNCFAQHRYGVNWQLE